MKNLPKYDDFIQDLDHLDESLKDYVKSALNKGSDAVKSMWNGVKRESKETKEAVRLIGEILKGKEVSDEQKEFIKAQSIDIVKAVPLIAVSGIPVPIPITPLLILLGKRIGWDILPNSHTKIDYKF